MERPQIAILGAGIFVRTEYIPRLSEISDLFILKAIWSRTEESARGAVDIAKKFFPNVECKWGDAGLDEITKDSSIAAVIVALAAQIQVDLSLKLLKAGKHVLQEKPAAASIDEVETALSSYNSLSTSLPCRPIWAVAENFRFEPALVEGAKFMADIGDMVNFQIIVEVPMNSSNPYFSTSWRHNFAGGYILDMGVHFVASLRLLAGCEVTAVSATTSHVDTSLPPPDNMSSVIQLENGCSGVLVTVVSAKTYQTFWRIVGLKGTLQIDVENREGKYGYLITLSTPERQTKSPFYPFSGVTEELKTFLGDVSRAILKKDDSFQAEPRISFLEGARDFAVLDAMLESGKKKGALVQVKKF
ncbi:putative oxidoreductase [Handroanthus impetiginosus]|uniref:Putative oxidoreductase n=1 Tax=Handroanthus impetiginosus TaxID=429701 RepID=A0A2G9HN63_9LAMI|nr:putative oxidoreductase [Handroanthus impetiginosus]